MLFTNSWFLSETGRKRSPANIAGAQVGAASRTRRAKQRRGSRENAASCARCGRREALTNGQGGVLKKGLAPQVKQRVLGSRDSLAKSLIHGDLLKIPQHSLLAVTALKKAAPFWR